jgi:hypothetical protein
MTQFPLGDGRFIELPRHVEMCDRVMILAGQGEFSVLFIRDDGTNARAISIIAVPIDQVGGLAKNAVQAAEMFGIDWMNVRTDIRPPQSGQGH